MVGDIADRRQSNVFALVENAEKISSDPAKAH
jgi:hypothetical protein